MMNKKRPKASLVLCVGLALVGSPGCSDRESNQLVGVGSATPALAIQEWEKSMASQGISLSYRSNGEKAGAKEFLEGSADFLLTTIRSPEVNTTFTREQQGIVSLPILRADIALVHTQRGCDMVLSKEEVSSIFKGTITNFSSFGCTEKPITVLTREEESGTRQTLYQYLGLTSLDSIQELGNKATTIVAPNMENVINAVPGGIGYIPGPLISFDNVFSIRIRGDKGTIYKPVLAGQKSNIEGGGEAMSGDNTLETPYTYPIKSTIFLVVKKNDNKKKMVALQRFARFTVSKTAQANAESLGYIKLTTSQENLAEQKIKTFMD
jgi:phosphate transport system substrate-binding protein